MMGHSFATTGLVRRIKAPPYGLAARILVEKKRKNKESLSWLREQRFYNDRDEHF